MHNSEKPWVLRQLPDNKLPPYKNADQQRFNRSADYRITIAGVGGAGGNIVNNLVRSNVTGCNFVVCNTDAQALQLSAAPRKIQLGIGVTRGLGAGARPDVGRAAAEEAVEEIRDAFRDNSVVFVVAGMGGGNGTGAAPVIARVAREMGKLTIGIVTTPFHFERDHRMRVAEDGIDQIKSCTDLLFVCANQNLFRIASERTTFADAFKLADDQIRLLVLGIANVLQNPEHRRELSQLGAAWAGTGEAKGDASAAIDLAISNQMFGRVPIDDARHIFIDIAGGKDLALVEVENAVDQIREKASPKAKIFYNLTPDENLRGTIRATVILDGEPERQLQQPPQDKEWRSRTAEFHREVTGNSLPPFLRRVDEVNRQVTDSELPLYTSRWPKPKSMRRRYLVRAVLCALMALITLGPLSFFIHYEITVAWPARLVQQEKEKADAAERARTEEKLRAEQKSAEEKLRAEQSAAETERWARCVVSKGNDSVCKEVCQKSPMLYGIDCARWGVDTRYPFEKRMEEEEDKFGRAMVRCLYGDKTACAYRRGD